MIHPKDVLLNKATGFRYKVCRVGIFDIQCRTIAEPWNYAYPGIDPDTLEIVDDGEWEVLECPHTITAPVTESHRDNAVERLAYNNSTMEFELFMVWSRLNRIIQNDISYDTVLSMHRLAEIIESIQAAADRLKPQYMVNGTVETPYLKAAIYENRK